MEKEPKTGGVAKIAEYADRIASGETLESVLDGLPTSMRQAVESLVNSEKVNAVEVSSTDASLRLPPQYEGLSAEIIEELWTIPIYVGPEKTRSENENKRRVLENLRLKEKEAEIRNEDVLIEKADTAGKILTVKGELGMETKKKNLLGLSPEELSNMKAMSVEDFAVWLAAEAKKLGKKLGSTSTYDALTARPEFRELRVAGAFGDSTVLLETFRENEGLIRKFKEDTASQISKVDGVEYVSGTWDHYKIQYEKRERKETHKGYLTINKDQVLTEFTPDVRHEIVKNLRDGGYRGQVKFPVTGSRALFSYDNIVLHGNESGDVDKGLEIVQAVLGHHKLNYEEPRRGVDAEGLDGKKTSYTDRIAQLVEQATKDPNIDLEAEIKKLKQ